MDNMSNFLFDLQPSKISLYIEEYGKNVVNNKHGIPKTIKYFDFDKKIFKELDNKDYLKNIKTIGDKEYKKLTRKKLIIRIALLLLFFFIFIVPILDLSLEKFSGVGLLGLLGPLTTKNESMAGISKVTVGGLLITLFKLGEWAESKSINTSIILFYCVSFLIFVVKFILVMVYYYNKVIKYENRKFRKKLNKKKYVFYCKNLFNITSYH
ncbi:hypothetical protein MKS88_000793 [Plasmodium brasilianum]|uniref:Uncharacterized protein n=1 Tax=Plasmodium brasilianum TaxID=5824 RepID=A0ACB9YG40_PLABR|nr:hypothetical protein MKS88_000793 [Plasmodium brasilianum]